MTTMEVKTCRRRYFADRSYVDYEMMTCRHCGKVFEALTTSLIRGFCHEVCKETFNQRLQPPITKSKRTDNMGGWSTNAKGRIVYMIDLNCEQCGKTFQAPRRDAKFCSVGCRKKSHRKINAIQSLGDDIIGLVERLNIMAADTNKDLRSKWKAQKELKRVRDEINKFR